MNQSYIVLAAALAALLAVRSLAFRGRTLRKPEQILADLQRLPFSVSIDESEMWGTAQDSQFWDEIGGMRGLWRIRRKAQYLRDFVQCLDMKPEDADELEFISHRCYWITVLGAVQFFLLPLPTPHFLARWSTVLYSEIRTRTMTLCEVYNRGLYGPLGDSA